MRYKRGTQGFTLVELLVTSALFVMLLGLVSQFFISQSRAASLQKAINEANEGTRTALALVTWDLQNAGYRATLTTTNSAYVSATDNGHKDTITTRFFDEGSGVNAIRKVRYDIGQGAGEIVPSLRRAAFDDGDTTPPAGLRAAVASMVAFNVRFETRRDAFTTPSSGTCPAASTPIVDDAGDTVNCRNDWAWKSEPDRLVRSVKVQLLGRSETRVPRYTSPVQSYTFDGDGEGGSSYVTEPSFIYHFAEQTVLTPNLGR